MYVWILGNTHMYACVGTGKHTDLDYDGYVCMSGYWETYIPRNYEYVCFWVLLHGPPLMRGVYVSQTGTGNVCIPDRYWETYISRKFQVCVCVWVLGNIHSSVCMYVWELGNKHTWTMMGMYVCMSGYWETYIPTKLELFMYVWVLGNIHT